MGKLKLWKLAAAGIGLRMAIKTIQKIREQQYSFQDKVVVITGGSRGLGLVLARQLAAQGAHLALIARNQQELTIAFEELDRLHARVKTYACDVTDTQELSTTLDRIAADFSRIDVLINNAGEIIVGPFKSDNFEDFSRLMKLHFEAPLQAIYNVLPYMQQQGGGRIVNISSIGGRVSVPHLLPYCSSKYALTGLSEGLSVALAQENVYVTTVTPGLMRTGSPRNVMVKGYHELEYRWFKIGDSLPLLTVSAENAAEQILAACKRKAPALTIGLPAKLLQFLHQSMPGLSTRLLRLSDRLILPSPVRRDEMKKGAETRFEHNRNPVTYLTDKAARKNNETLE